jgi:hypothetical protein
MSPAELMDRQGGIEYKPEYRRLGELGKSEMPDK